METGRPIHGAPDTTARHSPVPDGGACRPAGPGAPEGAREHAPEAADTAPPCGSLPCDLVTVPARRGLEAVDILRRVAPAVGPVLHDDASDTLGFVVPPGTAAAWDVPGSACTGTDGRGLRVPAGPPAAPDAAPPPPPAGTGWLLPPADTDPVTDPEALREALDEAARLIEAADNCR
ncbi:hypothetical protein [Streptomyces sp. DH12]|uniref:hypothetical protein n=1 Tax=Streptomyces sp. DH12 TaxID=2857010 RepID=UPI001E60E56D|nr:hypothetical protein [Streptomyces sp. DH12]